MIGGRDLSHKKAPIAKLPQLSILSMPVADMMVDLEVDKVADEVTDMLMDMEVDWVANDVTGNEHCGSHMMDMEVETNKKGKLKNNKVAKLCF